MLTIITNKKDGQGIGKGWIALNFLTFYFLDLKDNQANLIDHGHDYPFPVFGQ